MTDSPRESSLREVPGVDPGREHKVRVPPRRREASVDELVAGVLDGNRTMLGRAFTLVESLDAGHRTVAENMLERLLPRTGNAIRLGISGVPGSGKSTFIEALGTRLADDGHRVAVLAVDPSSEISGGSILGDKTRMERLAMHDSAIVRPSPSGSVPGGVARATRESILVAEAAGFDVVIVETVGVGQSETDVAWMTDFFLLLAITGAGDDLQGIKRGVLELADCVAINKADGDNVSRAEGAKGQLAAALRLLRSREGEAAVPVMTCSALEREGVAEIWSVVEARVSALRSDGSLATRRREQAVRWMDQAVAHILDSEFQADPGMREECERLRARVREGGVLPFRAARGLVDAFLGGKRDEP